MKKLLERFTPKTLKNKLLLTFTGTVVTGMTLVLIGLIFFLVSLIKTEWAESLHAQANLIAINSQAAVEFGDAKEAERILHTLAPNISILQATIFDLDEAENFAKYTYHPDFVPTYTSFPAEVTAYSFGQKCLRVQTYVPYTQERFIVELLISLEPVHKAILDPVIKTILAFNLVLLIFLILASRMIKKIAKPVYRITNLVENFTHNPKLADRILVKKEDEIAHLARNINQMMDSLQARDRELEEHRDSLERTILDRTQDLATALFDAEAANRAKSDFLARMSHEIRTPMNAIVGLGKLILKTELDSQQKSYQEQVISASEMLLRLINDILDYSKIEAGKLEVEKIPYNLEHILRGVSGQLALRAQEKGLELLFAVDSQVPRDLVGDPLRLSQVLVNLTNNAIKFTQEGEVLVRVGINTQEQVYIEVKDTGIGIPAQKVGDLFSPFTQVDGTMTRRFGGTGLGLAISKQLVELMGGEISVTSEVGRGSCFAFSLPLVPAATQTQVIKDGNRYNALNNMRVLVVDDNASAREILSTMVTQFGMRADVAETGEQAIEMFAQASVGTDPYRLVLLDWLMPEVDGIETARQINANTYAEKLPAILMITAGNYEKLAPQADRVGIKHILTKPVSESMLYDIILEALVNNETIQLSPEARANRAKETRHDADVFDFSPISYAKILLVDDVELNRIVALAFLEEAGFTDVDIAVNGLDAIEKIENTSYDLVLMDIQMPEMDGLTATQKVREKAQFANLPILAMTAHAMDGDRERSLACGLNDHLTKPIEPKILYKALLNWIPHKKPLAGRGGSEKTQAKPSATLPYIAGLDTEKGLSHCMNKPELYLHLLKSFNKEFGSNVKQALEAQEAQDWVLARRLAHSLKSGAATVGALTLSNFAKEAEQSFAAETALTQVLTRELTEESTRICKALQELETPAKEAEQVGVVNLDDCLKNADELIELLKVDDASSLQVLEKLEKSCALNSQATEILAELRDLIEDIEYAQAIAAAHSLIECLGENNV